MQPQDWIRGQVGDAPGAATIELFVEKDYVDLAPDNVSSLGSDVSVVNHYMHFKRAQSARGKHMCKELEFGAEEPGLGVKVTPFSPSDKQAIGVTEFVKLPQLDATNMEVVSYEDFAKELVLFAMEIEPKSLIDKAKAQADKEKDKDKKDDGAAARADSDFVLNNVVKVAVITDDGATSHKYEKVPVVTLDNIPGASSARLFYFSPIEATGQAAAAAPVAAGGNGAGSGYQLLSCNMVLNPNVIKDGKDRTFYFQNGDMPEYYKCRRASCDPDVYFMSQALGVKNISDVVVARNQKMLRVVPKNFVEMWDHYFVLGNSLSQIDLKKSDLRAPLAKSKPVFASLYNSFDGGASRFGENYYIATIIAIDIFVDAIKSETKTIELLGSWNLETVLQAFRIYENYMADSENIQHVCVAAKQMGFSNPGEICKRLMMFKHQLQDMLQS